MHIYRKNHTFKISNTSILEQKLDAYFQSYKFKKSTRNSTIIFYRKRSFLNTWQFNPLKWESRIEITKMENNTISISYFVEDCGQITPNAFANLYQDFIKNLEGFLVDNKEYQQKNKKSVLKSQKTIVFVFLCLLLASLFTAFLFKKLEDLSGFNFSILGIIVGFYITTKLLNSYFNNQVS